MWDFLKTLLNHSGTIALFYSVSMAVAGLAVRAMWLHNQALQLKLAEAAKDQAAAVQAVTEQYADRILSMERSHAARVQGLAERVDQLQEKRVRETREITERVVGHIGHIDATMDKLGTAVDVMIDLSGRRR